MAIEVDALFARYPDAHQPISNTPSAPFGARNVSLHVTTDESKALNDVEGPSIVIAASGMAAGGRILHHLHNRLSDSKATILFIGYQTPGTLGSMLVGGAKQIRIFGDMLTVRASIASLSGYSAHADQNELLRWLGTLSTKPRLYAVHGEPASAATFASVVTAKLGFETHAGERGTTIQL